MESLPTINPVLALLPALYVAAYRAESLTQDLDPEQETMIWALVSSSTQSLVELRAAVRLLAA
jgi:hypothetical protein